MRSSVTQWLVLTLSTCRAHNNFWPISLLRNFDSKFKKKIVGYQMRCLFFLAAWNITITKLCNKFWNKLQFENLSRLQKSVAASTFCSFLFREAKSKINSWAFDCSFKIVHVCQICAWQVNMTSEWSFTFWLNFVHWLAVILSPDLIN